MRIAIIRSCDRDDLIAYVCYLTMKKHNVANRYIFFHDGNNHPYISKSGEQIIYRESSGNFGGWSNVVIMLKELRKWASCNAEDYIIFSDSDIIIMSNPFDILPNGIDHAGYFNPKEYYFDKITHISGQFNIVKGLLWNCYINDSEEMYKLCFDKLANNDKPIADDTIFSVYANMRNARQFRFGANECWIHGKMEIEKYKQYL